MSRAGEARKEQHAEQPGQTGPNPNGVRIEGVVQEAARQRANA